MDKKKNPISMIRNSPKKHFQNFVDFEWYEDMLKSFQLDRFLKIW